MLQTKVIQSNLEPEKNGDNNTKTKRRSKSMSFSTNKKTAAFNQTTRLPFEQDTFGQQPPTQVQITNVIRAELNEEYNPGPLVNSCRKSLGFGTSYSLKQLKELIADIYV